MRESNSKGIAISGVCSALTILSLYGGVIVLNNKLFFMALAVAISGIPYASNSIRVGLISYISSSMLAAIILPNKIYAVVFIFLGIYPLIKLISENKKIVIEFLIKLIWFNSTIIVLYFVFNNLIHLEGIFNGYLGRAILLVSADILFIIYDYMFTKFIMFISDRVLKRN